MGDVKQAHQIASEQAASFPQSRDLLYDAACYACLLGKREEAEQDLHLGRLPIHHPQVNID